MQRRKSPTTVIVTIIVVIASICCLGVVGLGFLGYKFMKGTAFPLAGCMVAFTDVQSAVHRYADSHGGKLPNAETWQDDVKQYYVEIAGSHGSKGPFEIMKADGDWGCAIGENAEKTGMAFNSSLSGKPIAQYNDQLGVVLLFEIDKPRRNAAEPFKPRDKMSSPKMLGQPRGWIYAPLNGQANIESPNGPGLRINGNSNFDRRSN